MLDEAIEIATSAGDRRTLRLALSMAALAAVTQGRLAKALRRAERAAGSARQAGHDGALIGAMFVQAWIGLLQGRLDAAATIARETHALGRDSGEGGEGLALWLQAEVALAQADPVTAREMLIQARGLTAGDIVFAALPVLATARGLLAAGDRGAAAAAASDAAKISRDAGRTWILGCVYLLQARLEDDPATAEAHVHSAVALCLDAGDALGLVDAVELLAALAADRGAHAEALRLRPLFVSRATIKTHLVHIFAKLGIRSRSELAAEAIRRGHA